MILNLKMTFFVKRYLYTTRESHQNIYKYELMRYNNAYTYNDLNMSFTEIMSLPLFLKEEIYAIYKQTSDNRKSTIKNIRP